MKILNLYSGIGGNRHLWGDEHEITAVEIDKNISSIYQEKFPHDKIVNTDAHSYLLYHYEEYDFIWSSPPCPTHSRIQHSMKTTRQMKYPDMRLYQEIIFLQTFFDGKYVVENVIPYYEPLIPAQARHRHLYWCNFKLPAILSHRHAPQIARGKMRENLSLFHDYNFKLYKGKQDALKMARNLVDYEAGKTILETACGIIKSNNTQQLSIL
jgi:DNA (cytosine-5)-methyltransferase 1